MDKRSVSEWSIHSPPVLCISTCSRGIIIVIVIVIVVDVVVVVVVIVQLGWTLTFQFQPGSMEKE